MVLQIRERSAGVRKPSSKFFAQGDIPAVLYNKNVNMSILLDRKEFEKALPGIVPNTVLQLQLGSKQYRAFVKSCDYFISKQRDVRHVDFYLIDGVDRIRVKIPIRATGLPIGVTKGGHVERYVWNILVECDTKNIPDCIEQDTSYLDVKQKLYVKDLQVPDPSMRILSSPETAVLGVFVSSKMASKMQSSG